MLGECTFCFGEPGYLPQAGLPHMPHMAMMLTVSRLTIGPFKDLIGAAVGFSVINTYTVGQGYTCNVPGHSVGQVWGRHRMAWAEVKESVCSTCSGCQRGTQGYIRMPKYNPSDPLDGQVLGCSVGEIFTRC